MKIIFTKIIKETGRTAEAGSKSYFVEAFVEGTEPGNEEAISQDVFTDQTSDGNSQVIKDKPTVDKKDLYEFYVKDNGIGIEEINLEKIFDRFWQVEKGMTRKYGGTGTSPGNSGVYRWRCAEPGNRVQNARRDWSW